MTWLEWLVWRWDRRRARQVCKRAGHDIRGPEQTLGGWQVYHCTRCPHRFRADRTVPSGLDQSGPTRADKPDIARRIEQGG